MHIASGYTFNKSGATLNLNERWEQAARCLDAAQLSRVYLPLLFETGVDTTPSVAFQQLQEDITNYPTNPEAQVWSLGRYLLEHEIQMVTSSDEGLPLNPTDVRLTLITWVPDHIHDAEVATRSLAVA